MKSPPDKEMRSFRETYLVKAVKYIKGQRFLQEVNVPVTSTLAPVMYRESSEAKKAQTSATSEKQTNSFTPDSSSPYSSSDYIILKC